MCFWGKCNMRKVQNDIVLGFHVGEKTKDKLMYRNGAVKSISKVAFWNLIKENRILGNCETQDARMQS